MSRLNYIKSFSEKEKHMYDDYKNLGYDYKHHILKNVLSPELFGNPVNDMLFRQIEKLIEEAKPFNEFCADFIPLSKLVESAVIFVCKT